MIKWHYEEGTKATEGEVLQLLYALVSATKPEVCVETGTYAGHGTSAIARALEANDRGHLWTVESDPEVYELYEEVAITRTTFIHGDSLEFADSFDALVDFAFVDCGEPEHRLRVADVLWDKTRTDGLLLMHDTLFYEHLLDDAQEVLGPVDLHLDTLHGLAIWRAS